MREHETRERQDAICGMRTTHADNVTQASDDASQRSVEALTTLTTYEQTIFAIRPSA
jgi:hypothetical protein